MLKIRASISMIGLILSAALGADEARVPAAAGFDPQACARHCQEMAAAHQKTTDAHKAMMDAHDAAWKEIQAQLETARTSRGEKKVAALEAVVEKLVAFHASMEKEMGAAHGTSGDMMGAGMMGCCGGEKMGCCGHGETSGMAMGMDCPMMKGPTAHAEDAPKPAN